MRARRAAGRPVGVATVRGVSTPPSPDATADGSGQESVTRRGDADVLVRWSRRGDEAEIEVVDPSPTRAATDVVDATTDRVRTLLDRLRRAGSVVHLAADHPAHELDDLPEAVADAEGLGRRRDLLQLRRSLPVPADHPLRIDAPALDTRSYRPGSDGDAEAWIRVNNRAFADHPDQGHETPTTLAVRTAADWFDPAGFRVADDAGRPGELSGFCWTKVHPPSADGSDPALGEIYVIGVDPSHRGEGLGPAFVLAGLDHLHATGISTAMLDVDADNEPARRLYDRLGFRSHQRRRVYTA